MRHLTRPSLSYACVIRFCTASGPRSTGGAGMQVRVSIDRHSYARDASPKPRQTGMGRSQTRNQGLTPGDPPFGGDPATSKRRRRPFVVPDSLCLVTPRDKAQRYVAPWGRLPLYVDWASTTLSLRTLSMGVSLLDLVSGQETMCTPYAGLHRQPTRTCCSDSTRWAVMAYPVLTTSRT